MKHKTVMTLLKTMRLWAEMSRGVGQTLASVSNWSGVPRMTAYRYMKKMSYFGLVEEVVGNYRGKPATFYVITSLGFEMQRNIV